MQNIKFHFALQYTHQTDSAEIYSIRNHYSLCMTNHFSQINPFYTQTSSHAKVALSKHSNCSQFICHTKVKHTSGLMCPQKDFSEVKVSPSWRSAQLSSTLSKACVAHELGMTFTTTPLYHSSLLHHYTSVNLTNHLFLHGVKAKCVGTIKQKQKYLAQVKSARCGVYLLSKEYPIDSIIIHYKTLLILCLLATSSSLLYPFEQEYEPIYRPAQHSQLVSYTYTLLYTVQFTYNTHWPAQYSYGHTVQSTIH